MKKICLIFLSILMTMGVFANPVFVGFESVDISNLPTDKEPEEIKIENIEPERASLFNSTNVFVFVGLVGIYILFSRKRESRCTNL